MANKTETQIFEYHNGKTKIIYYPNSHRYKGELSGAETGWLRSVTGITGVLDKFQLRKWYARMAIDFLLSRPAQEIREMTANKAAREKLWEQMEAAPKDVAQDKADIGNELHVAIASYCRGDTVALDGMRPEVAACYGQFLDWAQGVRLVPCYVESPVVHPEELYAGTPDLIARLRDGETERLIVADWKTGGIWPEHVAQVCAYAKAAEKCIEVKVDRCMIFGFAREGQRPLRILAIEDVEKYYSWFLTLKHALEGKLDAEAFLKERIR